LAQDITAHRFTTFYRSHIAFENDEVFQECEKSAGVEIGAPREVFAEYEARV